VWYSTTPVKPAGAHPAFKIHPLSIPPQTPTPRVLRPARSMPRQPSRVSPTLGLALLAIAKPCASLVSTVSPPQTAAAGLLDHKKDAHRSGVHAFALFLPVHWPLARTSLHRRFTFSRSTLDVQPSPTICSRLPFRPASPRLILPSFNLPLLSRSPRSQPPPCSRAPSPLTISLSF
jgi:hypothetical protein